MKMYLPCPFCGSMNIGMSTTSGKNCYYKQCYCKNCHTYGPRLRMGVDNDNFQYSTRYKFEHDVETDNDTIDLWNTRK